MVGSFIPCCACYINLQSSNPFQVQRRPPFSFAAKARCPSESKAELLAECAGRSQFISIPGCYWAHSSLPYSSGLMFGLMRIAVSKGQGGGLLWGHTHTQCVHWERGSVCSVMLLINLSIFLSFLEEMVQHTVLFLTVNEALWDAMASVKLNTEVRWTTGGFLIPLWAQIIVGIHLSVG